VNSLPALPVKFEPCTRCIICSPWWLESLLAHSICTRIEFLPQELAEMNRRYEAKFGHVFLIFAAGRSAGKVLAAIKRR